MRKTEYKMCNVHVQREKEKATVENAHKTSGAVNIAVQSTSHASWHSCSSFTKVNQGKNFTFQMCTDDPDLSICKYSPAVNSCVFYICSPRPTDLKLKNI